MTKPPASRRSKTTEDFRLGHTLCELVMAIMILGICVATTAPRITHSIGNQRFRSTVKRVETDIKYARHLARRTGQEQKIVFEEIVVGGKRKFHYCLEGVPDIDHRPRDYKFHFDDNFVVEVDFEDDELVFLPSGRLKAEGSITIRYGGGVNAMEEVINIDLSGYIIPDDGT